MSDHKINTKPTSPHLQIYRWNISSLTSIMHRLTGVALYFSILAIAWFIVYYTYNIGSISEKENCECLTMNWKIGCQMDHLCFWIFCRSAACFLSNFGHNFDYFHKYFPIQMFQAENPISFYFENHVTAVQTSIFHDSVQFW